MNANELADELENTMRHRDEPVFTQAATMLRQQQAEIEALKMMLNNRNEALDRLDLKSTPCKYTEGM